ncbi:MAG: hypothetical protein AAGF01_28105 [Cyanobacteria bacterium P01_G01_bin.38]
MAYSTNARGRARRRRNSLENQGDNSSSQRSSSSKKPIKKPPTTRVNPNWVKNHLGRNFRIRSDVYSQRANEQTPRITFWKGELGPTLIIDSINNLRPRDWTNDFRRDLHKIRENRSIFRRGVQDSVDAIYILKPGTNQDELVTTIQTIANENAPQGKHYEQLTVERNDQIIQLQLVEGQRPAPTPPPRNLTARNQQAPTPPPRDLTPPTPPPRNLTAPTSPPRQLRRVPAQSNFQVSSPSSAVSQGNRLANSLRPSQAPTPIPRKPSNVVMLSRDFIKAMGKDPGKDDPNNRYAAIVKALDDYNAVVKQEKIKIEKLANTADLSEQAFQQANANIQTQKSILKSTISDYLLKSQTLGIKKSGKLGKFLFKKDPRLGVVNTLADSLDNANAGDVNETLDIVRQNNLLQKYNPLVDSQIDSTRQGSLLGVGAQGPVYSKFYNIQNRLDLPKLFEAGVKFDTGKANDEAVAAGIPWDNPGEAKRAVATYEASRLLGLNVIPPTTFVLGKKQTDQTDRQYLGQAMQRVIGTDGQRKVRGKEELNPIVYAKNNDPPGTKYDKMELEWDHNGKILRGWPLENLPVDVNFDNHIVQKELADLQILDMVIGHADRHFGNLRFEGTGPNDVHGVRGIDNDDTFGKDWKKRDDDSFSWSSKTPGVPPVIDAQTAVSILKVTSLDTLKNKLTQEEYTKTLDRLATVQAAIRDQISNGKLAIIPGQTLSNSDKDFLANQAGLTDRASLPDFMTWGTNQVFNLHISPGSDDNAPPPPSNSYLGEMVAMGNARGTVPWPINN